MHRVDPAALGVRVCAVLRSGSRWAASVSIRPPRCDSSPQISCTNVVPGELESPTNRLSMSLAPTGQGHEFRLGLVDEGVLKNTGQPCLALWYPSRVVLSYGVFVI